MIATRLRISALALVLFATGVTTGSASAARRGHWIPPQRLTWYWQLQGRINNAEPAAAYDIDGFDTPASEVRRLHAAGKRVVCYIDVGTWEQWRPDAAKFPRSLLGNSNGWPGERWLDMRRLSVLAPIMTARFRICQRKHFDGLEGDNLDELGNNPGFPVTPAVQLRYANWVARQAHALGLAVFQKNDPQQTRRLEPYFDGVLAESCHEFQECSSYSPYLKAGKPVIDAEYKRSLYPGFCAADARAGMIGALYNLALNGLLYRPCGAPTAS